MREDQMACKGAPTLKRGDMEECAACGDRVPWDLVDHSFWGFRAGCDYCRHSTRPERGEKAE